VNYPDDFRNDKDISKILKMVDESDYVNSIVNDLDNRDISGLLKRSDLHNWALSQLVRTGLFVSPSLSLKLSRQGNKNE